MLLEDFHVQVQLGMGWVLSLEYARQVSIYCGILRV